MKSSFTCLLLGLILSACGVQLKDKNQKKEEAATPAASNDLVVEKEFSVPPALIQSEKLVLRYDRLILQRGARFNTEGANLRIEADELIADNAVIQTFHNGQKATVGKSGRDGGTLEIVATHATGSLLIEMRGENGGDGNPGKMPDENLRGATGYTGQDAVYSGSYETKIVLNTKATDGGSGLQGKPGYSGENGFKGGDSGKLTIKIKNSENFKLETRRFQGLGGAGGIGGDGGPGGFGGVAGKDRMAQQAYTSPGAPGPQGPRGPTGTPGSSGGFEKICKEIDDAGIECE
jgi:hypothetical protein